MSNEVIYQPYNMEYLLIKAKDELNILNDNENTTKEEVKEAKQLVTALQALHSAGMNDTVEIKNFIKNINKLYYNGVLSTLSLYDSEFIRAESNPKFEINRRYPMIKRYGETIYNDAAFNCNIIKFYDHITNKQVNYPTITYKNNRRVYISKGGVIGGEYIEKCIIRPNIVNKHNFSIQSIITLPVSKICNNGVELLVVDHREPKLKALKDFYEVPVLTDLSIKAVKYNIRNYEKLK